MEDAMRERCSLKGGEVRPISGLHIQPHVQNSHTTSHNDHGTTTAVTVTHMNLTASRLTEAIRCSCAEHSRQHGTHRTNLQPEARAGPPDGCVWVACYMYVAGPFRAFQSVSEAIESLPRKCAEQRTTFTNDMTMLAAAGCLRSEGRWL